MSIKDIKTPEEFEQLVTNAKTPVLVDFVQEDCGACEEAKPSMEAFAKSCNVYRVDVGDEKLSDLADKLKVDGTPTTLLFEPGKKPTEVDVAEPEHAKHVKAKLKCALPVKKG